MHTKHTYTQAYRQQGLIDKARETYTEGTSKCPNSINFWLVAARFEVEAGQVPHDQNHSLHDTCSKHAHAWHTQHVRILRQTC